MYLLVVVLFQSMSKGIFLSKVINLYEIHKDVECITMDLSKADKKYALFFIYRPLKQNINFFLVRDNQKDFAFI